MLVEPSHWRDGDGPRKPALGLPHQGPSTDCMQFGFYNNSGGAGMCSFSRENVAQILATAANDGWLEASPGDRCVAR